MHIRKLVARRLFPLCIILALWWVTFSVGRAQSDITEVRVTDVDASAFPEVSARLVILTADGRRAMEVTEDDLELMEDGDQRITNFTLDETRVGVQVVFIIDASSNINWQGATRRPRVTECKEAIFRFVETEARVEDGVDWVTVLIAQSHEDGVIQVVGPTSTPREVYNTLYPYEVPARSQYTDLFDSLFEALRILDRSPGEPGMQSAIVIFSDGIDGTSDVRLNEVILQANQRNIPIHTALLGQQEPQNNNNLRALATLTGGHYTHLVSEEATDEIFDRIAEQRNQYEMTYESEINQSGIHSFEVRARSADTSYSSGTGEFVVNIAMPQVEIVSPRSNLHLTRTVESPLRYLWTSLLHQEEDFIEPHTLSVDGQVLWPEGQPRSITRAELLVNGHLADSVTNPGEVFEMQWDLSSFVETGDYDHTLVIRIYDEFELKQESESSQVHLHVRVPQLPDWEVVVGWMCGGLGLVLSLVLLLVLVRKRETIYRGVQAGVQTVYNTIRYGRKQTKAYLEVLDGEEVKRPIPINLSHTKIGRVAENATVLFHASRENSPISRLHCTIIEEDGRFYLRDEASGNGTFLNGRRLEEFEKEPLSDGDKIELGHTNLGGVKVQFRLATPDGHFPSQIEDTNVYERLN